MRNAIRRIEERCIPPYVSERKVWLLTLIAALIVAAVAALLIGIVGLPEADAATMQSPTGGQQYPTDPSGSGGAKTPSGLTIPLQDRRRFKVYGLRGHFTFTQTDRSIEFQTDGRGTTTADIYQLHYDVVLWRKPLHAKKGTPWKLFRQRHRHVAFEGGATALHLPQRPYHSYWVLPKDKRTYRYLLKARLKLSATDPLTRISSSKSRFYVIEGLPV